MATYQDISTALDDSIRNATGDGSITPEVEANAIQAGYDFTAEKFAQAIQRDTHQGTQLASTISDFTEAVQDAVAGFLGAGSNIALTYNDAANTFTINAASSSGGQFDPEATRDAIGAALIGVGNISVSINDAADTITISTTATANSTDAQLRDRSTHTGTQAATTITEDATHRFATDAEKTSWNAKATQADISAAIAGLVDGAPGALDTLKEISDQLASDEAGTAAILATQQQQGTKLATIATGATANRSDAATDALLATKVDKAAGFGLSSNDYTTAEKTKLAGIAAGATANRTDAATDTAITTGLTKLAATLPLSPLNSLLLLFGDSITQFSNNTSGTTTSYQDRGFGAMANSLSGVRYKTANLGVGGNTTADMVARLAAALALKPATVIILAGANDLIGSVTAATMMSNLDIIYQAFKGISCRVIAITVLPSFGTYALTTAKETIRTTVNAYIKTYPGITVLDADTLGLTSADFSDGLHLSASGAYKVGTPTAPLLAKTIDTSSLAGVIVPALGYTTNPLLTGGTTTATSWTLDTTNSGGATATGVKTADDKQQITLSGSYTGSTRVVEFFQSYTTAPQPVAGDVLEGLLDYEITGALTNVVSIHMQVQVYTSGFATLLANQFGLASYDAVTPVQFPLGRYTDRTATVAIGAGTPAVVVNRVRIVLKDTASSLPVAGVIKLYRIGVRKAQ